MSNRWDEIVNWDVRKESEDGFFENLLREYGVCDVLDMACGTGFHAIHLAQEGFNVDAADGSDAMLAETYANAEKHDVDLTIQKADWLSLTHSIHKQYDAVICLGNALTHLFEKEFYLKTIREVFKVLKKGGIFVVDQRNYDRILDKGYSSKHQYYYCGNQVEIQPVELHDTMVQFQYKFSENEKYHLTMHPIRQQVLTGYLKKSGFSNIRTFGDFQERFDPYEPDFVIQVAQKA
ncbi:MAG: class I SAM-dependent methyltransferase [Methanocalculus sp. MSAO_Arc1]|nr:MAG: class I SAM-dependent methyltransferase [Methanocalculus sp. MSAO_Arc1]